MIEYLKERNFNNRDMCYFIALGKFTSTILAEIGMIYVIVREDAIQDVIKDFICLGFIVELDDIFAVTSINVDVLNHIIDTELFIQKVKTEG